MFRRFLLFVAAAVIAACAAVADGSSVVLAASSRLALALFLFVPIVNAATNLLRGPPPI